jgi:hypothetical protein
MKDNFVIPANIPWDRLKGKDLEECLYWLLDEIGGKDLEWRLGGSGGGTADQGRDLEAYFICLCLMVKLTVRSGGLRQKADQRQSSLQ